MNSANAEITDRALAVLQREMASVETGRGETAALVYISAHVDRNHKTPDSFRPGYAVTAWPADQRHGWRIAKLNDGTEIAFFPTFKAAADARYSIGLASESFGLFSIDLVPVP